MRILSGIYKHYKGGHYQVLGIGEHTETKEKMVVYISLDGIALPGPRLRIRPLEGEAGWYSLVDGRPRFTYIGIELVSSEVS